MRPGFDSLAVHMVNPMGCRWCGIDKREHGRRWKEPAGYHVWEEPDSSLIKERMLERRNNAKAR